MSGAERFRRDPQLRQALLALARHKDTRDCLLLLEAVMDTPGLVERLLEVLRPGHALENKHGRTHEHARVRKEIGQ